MTMTRIQSIMLVAACLLQIPAASALMPVSLSSATRTISSQVDSTSHSAWKPRRIISDVHINKSTRLSAASCADDLPLPMETLANNVFHFLDDVSTNGQQTIDESIASLKPNKAVRRLQPPNNNDDNNEDRVHKHKPKPPTVAPKLSLFKIEDYEDDIEQDTEQLRKYIEKTFAKEQQALRAAQDELRQALQHQEQLVNRKLGSYMKNMQSSKAYLSSARSKSAQAAALSEISQACTENGKIQSAPFLEQPIHVDSPPEGITALFEWRQDEDGCISGRVRGSYQFREGAKVKTSVVPNGASGGTVVTTSSGSKYFLEHLPTASSSSTSTSSPSPSGSHEATELIIGSERVHNGRIVHTASGHRYLLSARTADECRAVERVTKTGARISISPNLRM